MLFRDYICTYIPKLETLNIQENLNDNTNGVKIIYIIQLKL